MENIIIALLCFVTAQTGVFMYWMRATLDQVQKTQENAAQRVEDLSVKAFEAIVSKGAQDVAMADVLREESGARIGMLKDELRRSASNGNGAAQQETEVIQTMRDGRMTELIPVEPGDLF